MVLFIVAPPIARRQIKCDRVPTGIIDKLKGDDDKIEAIEANLASIQDAGTFKNYTTGSTYKIELESLRDLYVFMNGTAVRIENGVDFMRPFSTKKLIAWDFGTIFLLRPGNCNVGLDKKYRGLTVSFESVKSPRTYLAAKENSTELTLSKVPLEGTSDCSAWSTCFVLSKGSTDTLIGSVEYPG